MHTQSMDNEVSEDEEGPCKHIEGLRLPLKPGTASGFVGVQRSASKKRPWQATLKVPGRKRLNVGSFKSAEIAAVARAQAKAGRGDLLNSPRKQAVRNSGASARPSHVRLRPDPDPNPIAHCCFLTRTCTVKQSTATVLEPLSLYGPNQRAILQVSPAVAPLGARDALAASAPYTPPYSAAFVGLQNARPLPPGPLPQGVAAVVMALPAQLQS